MRKSPRRTRRSRENEAICSRVLPVVLLLLVLLLLSGGGGGVNRAHAKEVIVTKEWTLVGENDTIPAGVHVRMDLEKGEKWVKLVEDDDDKGDDDDDSSLVLSRQHGGGKESVTVGADGSIMTAQEQAIHEVMEGLDGTTDDDDEEEPNYDFEMMHRALSSLPPEERERMQLPESIVPKGGLLDNEEKRALFEARMKQIWVARQEELRQIQEDFVADLPQILKDRIAHIEAYLHDPIPELVAVLQQDEEEEPEDNEEVVTHMVSVLQDLEFQLTDLDMTRDFHTLGGWPLLVSLLPSRIHQQQSNHTLDDTLQQAVYAVQANAAWALGTAIKNTGEFAPFATEPVLLPGEVTKTTALDVVLQELQLLASQDDFRSTTNAIFLNKFRKYLYALSSMLRGNAQAQRHGYKGLAPLGSIAQAAIAQHRASPHHVRLSKQLLALADDLLTELPLLHEDAPQLQTALRQALSTPEWCNAVLDAMTVASLQESAIKLATTVASLCGNDWAADLEVELHQIQSQWEQSPLSEQDVQAERINLVNQAVAAIAAQ